MLAYPTVEFRCLAVCDVEIKAREVKHKDDTADCSELVRGMVPALLLCRVNPWLPPRTGSRSHVRTLFARMSAALVDGRQIVDTDRFVVHTEDGSKASVH